MEETVQIRASRDTKDCFFKYLDYAIAKLWNAFLILLRAFCVYNF